MRWRLFHSKNVIGCEIGNFLYKDMSTTQKLQIAFGRIEIANMEKDQENHLSVPLILKHRLKILKDIKQVDGSDVNVSATCNVCSKVIKGSITSTTNFLNHLKRKVHTEQLQDYEKVKNASIKKRKVSHIDSGSSSESSGKCKKLKQSTLTNIASCSRSVNLDKVIVQFIVKTMSPVSIVESKSFRALIAGAQQLTKPPKVMCRHTAASKISDEYNEYKKKNILYYSFGGMIMRPHRQEMSDIMIEQLHFEFERLFRVFILYS